MSSGRTPRTPVRERAGRAYTRKPRARMGGVFALVIGLALLLASGAEFAYATALVGTPGRFYAEYPEQVLDGGRGGYHTHTVWQGTFRSDDGKVTDSHVRLDDGGDGDAPVPVTRAASGDYYVAKPGYVLGWLCGFFLGGCLLTCALPPLRFGRPFRPGDPDAPAWVRNVMRVSLGCLVTCGAAGAAALAVAVAG
ncbi:hypothetical protein GCM10010508_31230 [Streptomyces naganishii JCM 4654]|uniref:Uncharacterized protein n=2 Tax=Streptomyces naganishii TaxID=285447 RepID=A0A918Y4F2_9ACTN|nr:hypothetical protein GCM10010508_31230 [Streptomyces naganishii JCM 4654]